MEKTVSIYECSNEIKDMLKQQKSTVDIETSLNAAYKLKKYTKKELKDLIFSILDNVKNYRETRIDYTDLLDSNRQTIKELITSKNITSFEMVLIELHKIDKFKNVSIQGFRRWYTQFEGGIAGVKKFGYKLKPINTLKDTPLVNLPNQLPEKSLSIIAKYDKDIRENINLSYTDIANAIFKKHKVKIDPIRICSYCAKKKIS